MTLPVFRLRRARLKLRGHLIIKSDRFHLSRRHERLLLLPFDPVAKEDDEIDSACLFVWLLLPRDGSEMECMLSVMGWSSCRVGAVEPK